MSSVSKKVDGNASTLALVSRQLDTQKIMIVDALKVI